MVERKIIIGLITQTEYLRKLEGLWNKDYIESPSASIIAEWCWEYFKKYRKAPLQDIELIYVKKVKKGLNKSLAEEIGQEILPNLSDEYEKQGINISYLLDITKNYFRERQIVIHNESVAYLLSKGKVEEAQKLVENFKPLQQDNEEDIHELDLSDPAIINKIESAFDTTYQNVIKFPGALGEFMNEQLVRGGFVSILSPEKRGKTYFLIELMFRAFTQKRKVAFFQAGDMTENQFLMRVCVYAAKKSNIEKYCGLQFVPVCDCVKNQTDNCHKKIRECNFGVFRMNENDIRKKVTKRELIEAYRANPTYLPCYNCLEWNKNKWGCVWLKEVNIKSPLNMREAKRHIRKLFLKSKQSVKIDTYVNGTLTLTKIHEKLKKWREDGFVPDVILIDYADLVEAETKMEERPKQNYIWKGLRALSQEDDWLVVAPTQSDAASYSEMILKQKNFSEDKRKYGHVTAMYGLNQDPDGREKELGLMRINKIVIREGDFHPTQEVYILQRLQMGRPFLGSFY
jgi:hypothetical protein